MSPVGVCSCFIFVPLAPRHASPCVCMYHPLTSCPPLFRCVAHSLSLSLSSCQYCFSLLIWLPFMRSLLRGMIFFALRLLYAVVLCLFSFCLSFVFLFSLRSPFLVTICRLLSRPLPYVYIHPLLVCSFSDRVCSRFGLVGLRLPCDHRWVRSGSVNLR